MNPQPRQLSTRSGSLLTGRRRLLRHITHIQHTTVDLLSHRTLLLSRRGDLLVHRLDRRNRASNVLQRASRAAGQFDAAVGQAAAVVQAGRDLFGSGLQAKNQLLDLFSGLLGALGQACLLYTSPSPRDQRGSRMPSSA